MYKKFNKNYYQNGGKKGWFDTINDHPVTQVVKILDPTGVSSYGDVYNAWTDGEFTADDVLAPLSAIPLVGKAGKLASGIYKGAKLLNTMNKGRKAVNAVKNARKVYNTVKNYNALTKGTAKVGSVAGGIAKSTALAVVNPALGAGHFAGGMRTMVGSTVKGAVGAKNAAKVSKVINAPSRTLARGVEGALGNGTRAAIGAKAINLGLNTARVQKHWDTNQQADFIYGLTAPDMRDVYEAEFADYNNIRDSYLNSRNKDTLHRGGSREVMELQRQINAELHARGAKTGYIREDGLMGPKTKAALSRVESAITQDEKNGILTMLQ